MAGVRSCLFTRHSKLRWVGFSLRSRPFKLNACLDTATCAPWCLGCPSWRKVYGTQRFCTSSGQSGQSLSGSGKFIFQPYFTVSDLEKSGKFIVALRCQTPQVLTATSTRARCNMPLTTLLMCLDLAWLFWKMKAHQMWDCSATRFLSEVGNYCAVQRRRW